LVRHATLHLSSTDVLHFLGRKLHPNLAAEVVTDAERRPEGWRVKHRLARNWIKFYDKVSVLRVETVINNPHKAHRFGRTCARWHLKVTGSRGARLGPGPTAERAISRTSGKINALRSCVPTQWGLQCRHVLQGGALERESTMKRKVAGILFGVALGVAVSSPAFADQPPGLLGYEGQPGNQGGGSGQPPGLLGYEGQPGNQGG
jgi:hypothetical protein